MLRDRIMGKFNCYSPIGIRVHALDQWIEGRHHNYNRWKHWNFVKVRRWFINKKLHRRRCSECHILINHYGYEGIYDMCRDCFHEAHPY